MLTFGGGRIFLVAGVTDMRKSFNGLAGIVRERLEANPLSRHLFLFCNRDRNRLKALVAGGHDPRDSGGQSGGEDPRVGRRKVSRGSEAEVAQHVCD